MGALYYDLVAILRGAGCTVSENSITSGWETRARSSGGFSAPPLAVWWHHSASRTSVENDLSWMIDGCDDAPVGNLLLDRDGVFWPVAGGASNCAGKGGPATFSRGTSPLDQGNTTGFQVECANDGVGEPFSEATMSAYFRGSNSLNAFVGNQPTDVITHNAWAPTRKIDPATAAAVQGPWTPRSCTSSGTWDLDDVRAECAARAGQAGPGPGPGPQPPPEEDDVKLYLVTHPTSGEVLVSDMATFTTYVDNFDVVAQGPQLFGWDCAGGTGPIGLGPEWAAFLDQLPRT